MGYRTLQACLKTLCSKTMRRLVSAVGVRAYYAFLLAAGIGGIQTQKVEVRGASKQKTKLALMSSGSREGVFHFESVCRSTA